MKYTNRSVACLLGALLMAGTSQAAIQTTGSSCRPVSQAFAMNHAGPPPLIAPGNPLLPITYEPGPRNYDTNAVDIFCPIPAEVSIGDTADFTITVHDESPSADVRCSAGALDREGDLVALSATVSSSGRGKRTLTRSVELTDESTYSYFVTCTLPASGNGAGQSRLDAIRTK